MFLHNMIFPIKDNQEYYLKLVNQMRKEKQFDIINHHFTTIFETNFEKEEIFLSNNKVLWNCGHKNEVLNNFKFACIVITKSKEKILKMLNSDENFFKKVVLNILSNGLIPPCIINFCDEYFHLNKPNEIIKAINVLSKEKLNIFLKSIEDIIFKGFYDYYTVNPPSKNYVVHIYNRYAKYLYTLKRDSLKSNLKAAKLLSESLKIQDDNYKTYKKWAYVNLRLATLDSSNEKKYIFNSIQGYYRTVFYNPEEGIECICLISSLINGFKFEGEYKTDRTYMFNESTINKILPQIWKHINHQDPYIRQTLIDSILKFGEKHYQALIYDLYLYSHIDDEEKAKICNDLSQTFQQQNPIIAKDANLFIEGMVNCSITILEQWIRTIEAAFKIGSDSDEVRKIFQKQFERTNNPQCSFDKSFCNIYGQQISKCYELFKKNDSLSKSMFWSSIKILFQILKEKEDHLCTIILSKISEPLAEKKDFEIAIPGKYKLNGKFPLIKRIRPTMDVMNTKQYPREVVLLSNEGEKIKYLLKGNEDLRLDKRIMQFFSLANHTFKKSIQTKSFSAFISRYAVIPMTTSSGLITWVINASTMHQIIINYRKMRNISITKESEVLEKYCDTKFQSLNGLQRYELFELCAQECKAHELFEFFWVRSPNAAEWFNRRERFTVSTSIMSIVGYLIGLGDRHPGNIMINHESGSLIHIDFGEIFESTCKRHLYPERVPFRLTRMISNALMGCSVDGYFTEICEKVMTVLRENDYMITAQLSLFLYDRIYEDSVNEDISMTSDKNLIHMVECKLHGKEWQNQETTSQPVVSVKEQVSSLINTAADPLNYSKHYSGWCPFW